MLPEHDVASSPVLPLDCHSSHIGLNVLDIQPMQFGYPETRVKKESQNRVISNSKRFGSIGVRKYPEGDLRRQGGGRASLGQIVNGASIQDYLDFRINPLFASKECHEQPERLALTKDR